MTKAGIEYDLSKTPYREDIKYGFKTISFYFSSDNAKEKFLEELLENRRYLNDSLSNRFKMKFILSDEFCDVQLYKKLERRGFLITIEGVSVRWPGKLVFNGQKLEVMN